MSLHKELLELRKKENEVTALILEKLQLMENSKDYLPMGYSSLFDYLVRGLKYSESTAYQRQACVRLSKEMPEIKEKIERGQLTYSTLAIAYKSMRNKTVEQKRNLVAEIENKSTREVKALLLEPAAPIKIHQQIYQDKVILKLEMTHDQHNKLERLKKLKSHKYNLESLLENLIDRELKKYEVEVDRMSCLVGGHNIIDSNKQETSELVSQKLVSHKKMCGKLVSHEKMCGKLVSHEKMSQKLVSQKENNREFEGNEKKSQKLVGNEKKNQVKNNPRYISRRLRNAVLLNANYRCEYPGCESNHFLQLDHIKRVRHGGSSAIENLQVLCAAHNQWKG
jgi:hypothetical protein